MVQILFVMLILITAIRAAEREVVITLTWSEIAPLPEEEKIILCARQLVAMMNAGVVSIPTAAQCKDKTGRIFYSGSAYQLLTRLENPDGNTRYYMRWVLALERAEYETQQFLAKAATYAELQERREDTDMWHDMMLLGIVPSESFTRESCLQLLSPDVQEYCLKQLKKRERSSPFATSPEPTRSP